MNDDLVILATGGYLRPQDRWAFERWAELVEGGIEPHLAHDLAATEAEAHFKRLS